MRWTGCNKQAITAIEAQSTNVTGLLQRTEGGTQAIDKVVSVG